MKLLKRHRQKRFLTHLRANSTISSASTVTAAVVMTDLFRITCGDGSYKRSNISPSSLCLLTRFLPAVSFLLYLLFLYALYPFSAPDVRLSLQCGGAGLPEGPAGGPGGQRADGDPEGEGGDVAGGVSAHQDPDQRGADSPPSGTAGLGGHRASGHGEVQNI